jgi:hypothetical protein
MSFDSFANTITQHAIQALLLVSNLKGGRQGSSITKNELM